MALHSRTKMSSLAIAIYLSKKSHHASAIVFSLLSNTWWAELQFRRESSAGTGRHFSFSLFYCIQRVSSEQSLCGALLLLSAKHGRQCARGQLAKFLLVSPVSLVKEIRPVYI